MFSGLPAFGAGSGKNQGPVGCLAALVVYGIMLAGVIGFFALVYWAAMQLP